MGFIVAGGNGAVLLEFSEEVFDKVAGFVKFLVIFTLDFTIGFGWDDSGFSHSRQWCEHSFIGIIGFIGKDNIGCNLRQ